MNIVITKDENINDVDDLVGTSALIRVVDPGMGFTVIHDMGRYEGILEILFHDYTPELFDELGLWRSSFRLLSDIDGETISRFVYEHRHVDNLVIHCVEGRSRSVAIGLAVSDHFGLIEESNRLRSSKLYCPNPHVYDVVLLHLNRLGVGNIEINE